MPRRRKPHPVDVHVGQKLRTQRTLLGLSQTELAERLGVMWQQLRKYETAYNRISAGCLWQAAKALGVPISYFFEGLNGKTDAATDNLSAHAGPELLRDFESCPEEVKKVAFLLLKSMAKKPKPLP